MTPESLRQIVARYAELDREIGELISARLSHVCAACAKPCCRADVCRQVVESWWLRTVSEHVHGRWWPDDWQTREQCIAMGPDGCTLKAGRAVICRSFVCDHYAEAYGDLWEAVFVSFASDLLWEVGQLTSSKHIEEVAEENFPRYAGKLAGRIAAGRRQFDLARRLLDADAGELEKHRIALRLICEVPRCLRATTRRAILARLGE